MFEQLGSIHPLLPPFVGVLALLAGAVIIDLIAKRLLVGTVRAFAKRSSFTWDDDRTCEQCQQAHAGRQKGVNRVELFEHLSEGPECARGDGITQSSSSTYKRPTAFGRQGPEVHTETGAAGRQTPKARQRSCRSILSPRPQFPQTFIQLASTHWSTVRSGERCTRLFHPISQFLLWPLQCFFCRLRRHAGCKSPNNKPDNQ